MAADRTALEEWTRDRGPLQWAMMQTNLGNALRALGERESGTARLQEAMAAGRAALQEYTRERVPLDWAESYGYQGVAMMRLAERTKDAAMAKAAVAQISAAHETLRAGGDAPGTAKFQARLAEARPILQRLGGR